MTVVAFKGGTDVRMPAPEREERPRSEVLNLIRHCSERRDLSHARQAHRAISASPHLRDPAVQNWLVQMYLKCGALYPASDLFHQLLLQNQVNLVVWTSMIAAHASSGQIKAALHLFQQMQLEGNTPDRITLVTVFKACSRAEHLDHGKRVHAHVDCESDVPIASSIIAMYARCGSVEDARLVFESVKVADHVIYNSFMGALVQNGCEYEALELYWCMMQRGFSASRATFVTVLGACAVLGRLREGTAVHAALAERGFDADVQVQSALVNMYGKCGSLGDAVEIFDRMPRPDVVLWSSVVAACVKCGVFDRAFTYFRRMQLEGNRPNRVTLVNVLSACNGPESLENGRRVHEMVVEAGYGAEVIVGNAVVNMYGKCGSLEDAWRVFHGVEQRSVITCNVMMGACAALGDSSEAVRLFQYMLHEGLVFDNVTLVNALCACSGSASLVHGEFLRSVLEERGVLGDVYVANALLNMYSKCGEVETACRVFQKVPQQDVRTWNGMILAYVENGEEERGFSVFRLMMQSGFRPDEVTFALTLNACQRPRSVREVHFLITETGKTNLVVENALIVMYGRFGLMEDAYEVFETLDHGNVTTWNVMIAACTQSGLMEEAFYLFREMQLQGVIPNKGTLLIMLNGSTTAAEAKVLRSQLTDEVLESHNLLKIALLNLYGRCGTVQEALDVFERLESPPTPSWNALLAVHVQSGHDLEATELISKMLQAGAVPDKSSFVAIIKAYTNMGITEADMNWIQTLVADFQVNESVLLGNAFIGLFGRLGSLARARDVFNKMAERDVVSWNTLMSVYEQLQQGEDAIQLFRQMLQSGTAPDKITLLMVFNVCGSLPALQAGRSVQAWLEHEPVFWSNQKVANAVLSMYVKCSSRDEAVKTFNKMQAPDSVSWNALLGAYGNLCKGKYTLELFQAMQLEGIFPDAVTFTIILSICSHGGLLSEGCKWFRWMLGDYFVEPVAGHYGCIVDLLGRLGRVGEAEEVVKRMPVEADSVLWTTLLGACKVHGDFQRGKRVADELVNSNPKVSSAYVMLSTLYRDDS